ncbi:MAG: Hsp20/alpha crystallin family protein [Thermoleophilia bacterium]|jgi:HSP20 family protein|nr:Hsp20/alpha crystallin family protein [Thermoleophilia bacterium]
MAAIVRWDPFREMSSLRDEMNRLFSRSIGETGGASAWTPAVDVFDGKEAITLKAELPGLAAEDIDIEVDDNVLTIRGERRFEEKVEDGRYYRLERAYGSFSRSLQLPQGIRADDIAATFDKGVLEVRVPKADEVRPRRIAVSAQASAAE